MPITNPLDITGCVLWLDAGDISETDGNPVGTWTDQSVEGNNATASGTDRPTYRDGSDYWHGQANLEWSTQAHRLDVAADVSLANGNVTYVVTCRLDDLDGLIGNQDPLWLINKNNTNPATVGIRASDEPNAEAGFYEVFFRLDGSEGTVRQLVSRAPTRNAWITIMFRYDGTDGELWIQDQLSDSLTVSGSIDTDTNGILSIGNHPTVDNGWTGRIAEVVVYDNAISDTDKTDLFQYMFDKYPNSPYIKEAAILSTGNRHVRIRSADESGLTDNQMLVVETNGDINHYTSTTANPHSWTLQNSDVIANDPAYRTLDFWVESDGTWSVFVDRATGNGEIELWTGAAVTSLTEHVSSPVITGSVGDYPRTPAVIEEGGRWTMLLDVRTDSITGGDGYLDRYTSTDGTTWTKDTTNSPVVSSTGTGFESTDITHPQIHKRGWADYLIVYAGYNDNHSLTSTYFPHEIGLLYSPDLINFTRSNMNPILTYRDSATAFDQAFVANPCLFKTENEWSLYYSGGTDPTIVIRPGYALGPKLEDSEQPRIERWHNDGTSTLSKRITDATEFITVDSAANFPGYGDFEVRVENEILTVTHVAGTEWRVLRGQEGTTAAPHDAGVPVTLQLTAGSLDRAFKDGFARFDYPMNRVLENGTTRTHSDFTWFNQGTATSATADDGGILMTLPNESNDQIRGKYITAPTAPWTLTTFCQFGPGCHEYTGTAGEGSYMGPLVRDSTTGEIIILLIRGDRIAMFKMDSPTTLNSGIDSYIANNRSHIWLRIEDDNTNLKGWVSGDGYVWEECFSEARTNFLTPDQVGFGCSSGTGSAGAHYYFKTWIID